MTLQCTVNTSCKVKFHWTCAGELSLDLTLAVTFSRHLQMPPHRIHWQVWWKVTLNKYLLSFLHLSSRVQCSIVSEVSNTEDSLRLSGSKLDFLSSVVHNTVQNEGWVKDGCGSSANGWVSGGLETAQSIWYFFGLKPGLIHNHRLNLSWLDVWLYSPHTSVLRFFSILPWMQYNLLSLEKRLWPVFFLVLCCFQSTCIKFIISTPLS